MNKTSILVIRFKNDIRQNEIPKFRGAVIDMLQNNNILFHNHTERGLRYAYPLIQYKRLNNKAAIVCLEEGTASIGEFFTNLRDKMNIGNREIILELDIVKAEQMFIQLWENTFTYSLRKWLPFNSENYEKYQQTIGLKEKIEMMEKILTGNLLSFAKGINIHFEKELTCSITESIPKELLRHKGVSFASFDVLFKTNVSLPNYIGLGKGVSHGFGTIVRMNINKTKIKQVQQYNDKETG